MKKTITLILMVLFVTGVAFAATTHTMASDTAPDGTGASIFVSLAVENSDFLGGQWGFTAVQPTFASVELDAEVPTAKESIVMDVQVDKTADNTDDPVYAFWQYRTTGGAVIEIKSTALVKGESFIKLYVQPDSGNKVPCADDKAVVVYTNSDEDRLVPYQAGSVKLNFTTDALDATHIGNWKATVSMTVTANA